MKVLCHLVHPAHYHLFKNSIKILKTEGCDVLYTIRNKDVLKDLLINDGHEYLNIEKIHRAGITGFINRLVKLYSVCKKYKPDVLISSAVEAAYVAKMVNAKSFLFFEDDLIYVKPWAILTCPIATELVCPDSCSAWLWDKKALKYPSYHELAYLHPTYFKTENKSNTSGKKKFLIRLAKLTAYHDGNNPGIDDELLDKVIDKLLTYGDVFISGERELPDRHQKYKTSISPDEMLNFLAKLDLYIGDSQTMAAEAAVLGVPSIRFNNFVGKLGYLEELENRYQLTFGINQKQPELLIKKIDEILSMEDIKKTWSNRKARMLQDKSDPNKFIIDLIKGRKKLYAIDS